MASCPTESAAGATIDDIPRERRTKRGFVAESMRSVLRAISGDNMALARSFLFNQDPQVDVACLSDENAMKESFVSCVNGFRDIPSTAPVCFGYCGHVVHVPLANLEGCSVGVMVGLVNHGQAEVTSRTAPEASSSLRAADRFSSASSSPALCTRCMQRPGPMCACASDAADDGRRVPRTEEHASPAPSPLGSHHTATANLPHDPSSHGPEGGKEARPTQWAMKSMNATRKRDHLTRYAVNHSTGETVYGCEVANRVLSLVVSGCSNQPGLRRTVQASCDIGLFSDGRIAESVLFLERFDWLELNLPSVPKQLAVTDFAAHRKLFTAHEFSGLHRTGTYRSPLLHDSGSKRQSELSWTVTEDSGSILKSLTKREECTRFDIVSHGSFRHGSRPSPAYRVLRWKCCDAVSSDSDPRLSFACISTSHPNFGYGPTGIQKKLAEMRPQSAAISSRPLQQEWIDASLAILLLDLESGSSGACTDSMGAELDAPSEANSVPVVDKRRLASRERARRSYLRRKAAYVQLEEDLKELKIYILQLLARKKDLNVKNLEYRSRLAST